MAHRSQCSSAGDNPLDPNYLPPHYREEYRLAIDALIEADLEGYYGFLQEANVVDFLSRPEIEYIKCTLLGPRQTAQPDRRYMTGDGDGSSDTYWPIQSDLDAPGLDLGWPPQHRFVGPTEIMTLVNPSDPEMPSIKEQIRRMIKNAQQVVAVVMDMFTDVDIFADILNAAMRNVAVYVLLDEMNAHHFVAMANNCRVNLDEIKFLRVRTVSGSTYFCHTGKWFKGQMMNRFMLVDCRIVLSGNYSFMWSFEKIHRCLAHVFTGQLVATFDEEFRILYAQSEMLVTQNPMTYVEDYGTLTGRHDIEGSHIFKRQFSPFKGICSGWPGHSLEDSITVQSKIFRRDESNHRSTDEHLPLTAHSPYGTLRGEPSYLDKSRLMKGLNTKEKVGFKTHGYTGIPDSQINPVIRGEQHVESAHYFSSESGYDIYGKSMDQSYHNLAQFSGSEFAQEMNDAVAPGDYDHVQRYLRSCPAVESIPPGNSLVPVESTPRRHSSIGQSYTCQTSPTQPTQPDQKYFFNVHHKQQDQKEGLRDWRISSYLIALQHSGQYDTADLQRTDSYDNVSYAIQGRPFEPDISDTRQDNSGFTKDYASKLNTLPIKPFNNLTLPEKSLDLLVDLNIFPRTAKPTPPTTSESSYKTEGDKMEEMQNKERKETNLIREEFVRTRPNLGIQRSSRLRHSLIFNSNLDQHTSEGIGNSLSQNDGAITLKQSSIISTILEKKRPVTREPFQWSSLGKSCDAASDSALKFDSDVLSKDEISEMDKVEITNTLQKASEQESSPSQSVQPLDAVTENSQTTQLPSAMLQRSASFMDMTDPDCRLRYFKELAAKRKAELALTNLSTKDKASKEPDKPKKSLPSQTVEKKDPALETSKMPLPATSTLPTSPKKMPVDSIKNSQECSTKTLGSPILSDKYLKHKLSPESKVILELSSPKCTSSCREIPASATDAEKIKLKKQLTEECDSCSNTLEDKSASAANPAVHLNTKRKLTSRSSPVPTISSPEYIFLQTEPPEVTDSGVFSSPSVLQKPKNLKLTLRDSISSHVVTDVNAFLRPSSRKSTLVTTDATAINTVHSQQPSATETHFCVSRTETSLSKQLVPAETVPSQSALSETAPSLHSTAADPGPLQYSAPVETGPSQFNIPAQMGHDEKIDTTQYNTSKGTGSYEHSAGSDFVEKTETIQHTTAKETGSSQHPTAEQTGSSQHPAPEKNGSSEHLIAKETSPIQHPTAKETSPFQPLNLTDLVEMTVTTPHYTAKETISSHHPTAKETGSSQHSTTKEIGSSQNPTTKETGFSKNHIAKGCGPFQHSTANKTSNSHLSTLTGIDEKTDTTQHTIAKGPGPSQHSNSTDLAEKTVTQHTTAKETSPSQETNSKDLTKETVFSQHPIAEESDSLQLLTAKEALPSNSAKTDYSQHFTADPSERSLHCNTASGQVVAPSAQTQTTLDMTGVPASAVSNSNPHSNSFTEVSNPPSTTSVTNAVLHPALLSPETALPSNTTEAEFYSSQLASAAGTGYNSKLSKTKNFLNTSLDITAIDILKKKLDSVTTPSTILSPEDLSSKQHSLKTDSKITSPPKTTSVLNPPSTTSVTNAILHPALLSPETGVPRDWRLSLTETDPATSTLHTDQSSGNTASDMSHLLLKTVSLDINSPNNSMSSKTNLCINKTVTDSTPEAGVSQTVTLTIPCTGSNDLNPSPSPSLSADILTHSSSDVCQTVDPLVTEIQTAQEISEIGSHSASNPSLSCDPKSEETKDGKRESTKEQTQQERLVVSVRHAAVEALIDQVNKTKEATAHAANPGSSSLEQSQETQCCQDPCTDLVNQQPHATEKHTHQSTTANVLSCSNLRDDTKVLLEQISAKNQGRASKTKEEDEAHVNTITDNQISSHLHCRPQFWSSKASPEEREKLLKRMDSMRKEKKVYSRFEAP